MRKPRKKLATLKVNQEWFQNRIAEKDLTQRAVAKVLKIDPAMLSAMFKGKRRLQSEEAIKLAKLLDSTLDEILHHAGVKTNGVVVADSDLLEVSGWVDSQFSVHFEKPKGPRLVARPADVSSKVEVVRVQTAGTKLDSLDGALIYFVPVNENTTEKSNTDALLAAAIGQLSLVLLKKREKGVPRGDWKLRVVRRGYGAGTFNLSLLSGEIIEDDVELEAATPVLWMKL